jgi:hypothetical protein
VSLQELDDIVYLFLLVLVSGVRTESVPFASTDKLSPSGFTTPSVAVVAGAGSSAEITPLSIVIVVPSG